MGIHELLGRLVRYWLCLPIHSFCCACFGFQLEWRRHTGEPHTPTSYGYTCVTINRIGVLYRLAQKVYIAHRRRPAYMYLSQQATHVPLFQQRSELTSLQNPIRIPNDKEFLCLCAFPARMASIPRVRKGGSLLTTSLSTTFTLIGLASDWVELFSPCLFPVRSPVFRLVLNVVPEK